MSEWDALSDDDQDWELGQQERERNRCPVCGGYDPERLCQNPKYQHAWEVKMRACFKQRAVIRAMNGFKDNPFQSTLVPYISLNEAKAKTTK